MMDRNADGFPLRNGRALNAFVIVICCNRAVISHRGHRAGKFRKRARKRTPLDMIEIFGMLFAYTATFGRWKKPFRARRQSVATCGRRIELVVGV